MKIIFLDPESVLRTPGSAATASLNWLISQTGAGLVLTSGGVADAAELLARWGVQGEVLGFTASALSDCKLPNEIKTWLERNREAGPIEAFVILDDRDTEYTSAGPFASRLIRTAGGLTKEHAEAAKTVLQTPHSGESIF